MYVRRTLPGPSTIDPQVDRAQYEADCLAGRRLPVGTDMVMQARCRSTWRLREWFEIFRRYHLSTVKDSQNRAARFGRYFTELLDLDPNTITRLMLMPWFQQLGRQSHATANNALMELTLVYTKMIEWGWHEGANLVAGMKKFPHNKPRKRFVQLDELGALLDSIAQEPPPYQLLFLLCINVGCRPGEAVAMQWRDIKIWGDEDPIRGGTIWRGRWTKPTTKTDTEHTVPIPSLLAERFLELDHTSDWIFPGLQNHPRRVKAGPLSYAHVHTVWQRICRRIGIENLHPHDLRRSCATYLSNRGTNLAIVSKGVLNHVNLQHTGVYVQTMLEPVTAALQEHSEWVMRGGRELRKAPLIRQPTLPAPAGSHAAQDAMEWPG